MNSIIFFIINVPAVYKKAKLSNIRIYIEKKDKNVVMLLTFQKESLWSFFTYTVLNTIDTTLSGIS